MTWPSTFLQKKLESDGFAPLIVFFFEWNQKRWAVPLFSGKLHANRPLNAKSLMKYPLKVKKRKEIKNRVITEFGK